MKLSLLPLNRVDLWFLSCRFLPARVWSAIRCAVSSLNCDGLLSLEEKEKQVVRRRVEHQENSVMMVVFWSLTLWIQSRLTLFTRSLKSLIGERGTLFFWLIVVRRSSCCEVHRCLWRRMKRPQQRWIDVLWLKLILMPFELMVQ